MLSLVYIIWYNVDVSFTYYVSTYITSEGFGSYAYIISYYSYNDYIVTG
jgi:hypothetical protein